MTFADTYFTFIEKLMTIASSETKEIRNAELSSALDVTAKVREAVTAAISEGVSIFKKV